MVPAALVPRLAVDAWPLVPEDVEPDVMPDAPMPVLLVLLLGVIVEVLALGELVDVVDEVDVPEYMPDDWQPVARAATAATVTMERMVFMELPFKVNQLEGP